MSRDDDIVVFEHERDQVTVGDLQKWHCVEVTCPACSRVGRVYPASLQKRYAADTRVAELADRFRCCRCWAKGSGRWKVFKIARNA
ncbi:MAG: hypothetical protein AAGA21_16240 [Pseudomonadota bacterium]